MSNVLKLGTWPYTHVSFAFPFILTWRWRLFLGSRRIHERCSFTGSLALWHNHRRRNSTSMTPRASATLPWGLRSRPVRRSTRATGTPRWTTNWSRVTQASNVISALPAGRIWRSRAVWPLATLPSRRRFWSHPRIGPFIPSTLSFFDSLDYHLAFWSFGLQRKDVDQKFEDEHVLLTFEGCSSSYFVL